MDILKAFVSWSGGKESSLSLYRVIRCENIKVVYLLNMLSEDGKTSRSHGISSELLRAQAGAIGIPIIQRETSWERYEEEFKKAINDLKKEGINAGVFGDIDLQEHRDWVERICSKTRIIPVLPLWNEEKEKILKEFLNSGFKAIVCSTNVSFLGKEWLGREINNDFIKDLKALDNIDLCGERGEYHSFVYDGPIFKKPFKFLLGEKILNGKNWFLEVKKDGSISHYLYT